MVRSLTYRFMWAITVVMILIVSINFMWDINQQKRQAMMEMREKAQVITKELIATREFIAQNQNKINCDASSAVLPVRNRTYATEAGAVDGACAPSASYLAKRWPHGDSARHCSYTFFSLSGQW